MPETPLERAEHGLVPAGEGWFVLNAGDAQWFESYGLGAYVTFEGANARFAQFGINVAILDPGEPNCMYHAEGAQEDFLVLAGECLVIVEGQERLLRAWDFVHCPAGTEHVFVGAGKGPCLLLAVGARLQGRSLVYPVNDVALRHGAGVQEQTSEGSEAYAAYRMPEFAPRPAEYDALVG